MTPAVRRRQRPPSLRHVPPQRLRRRLPRAEGGGSNFVEIDAADFLFSPKQVSAAADVDLDFVISNTGQATHTFNLYRDADYTQTVENGKTQSIVSGTVGEFHVTLAAGEYFFRCEFHPQQMQGTLTVD